MPGRRSDVTPSVDRCAATVTDFARTGFITGSARGWGHDINALFIEVDTESEWAVASIGPAFIASYLRREGHGASLLRVPPQMSPDEVVESIEALQPDLLGLSLTTRQWLRARSLVRDIRARPQTA